MKEEQKWRIFHWVERALVKLDLIGDKGKFNTIGEERERKVREDFNLNIKVIGKYGGKG